MAMDTSSVKNFEKFQHYKDRNPPWIRLYNALLDDYEYGLLPDASKSHLCAIWLLASRYDNKIPCDPEWISRRINATDAIDLDLLSERGFILMDQGCSKMLADCKQSAVPEESRGEQRQRRGETDISLYSKKNITRPSKRRTIVYSDLFLMCWEEYQGLKEQGASKLKAFETFDRLSEAEQDNCYDGLACYVKWVYEKRKSDPEFRAKHLATFINQRVWENFIDADPEPNQDDPAPTTSGNGSQATSQHR